MNNIIKFFLTISFIIVFGPLGFSQSYNINNVTGTTVTGCNITLYDSGGSTGDYAISESYTVTICSGTTDGILLNFASFATESCCDHLYIYNGPTTASPLVGTYQGTTIPPNILSTGSCVTIKFTSDGSINASGFQINASCVVLAPPTCSDGIQNQGETGIDCGGPCPVCTNIPITAGDQTTCIGTFTDSGGSAGDYVSSEDYTITFTPNSPCSYLQFVFSSFATESVSFDWLKIYDGPNISSPLIGTYGGTTSPGTITATNVSGSLTFVWHSDGSVVNTGWIAAISCIAGTQCSGTPTVATVVATPNTLNCSITSTVLSATNLATNCGITYQWQSATAPGGPWTNIPGATNATLTASPTSNTYYNVITTCTNSGLFSNSIPVLVNSSIAPPSNDECTGATPLTVNPNTTCSAVTPGTVSCATASAQANGCFGSADDDVWYSFVATNANQTISLLNITGSTTDMYFSVFPGNCSALGTPVLCSDPEIGNLTGLTVGQTYYIRVYTLTATSGQSSAFNICVGTPPPPGPGDNCSQANPFCTPSVYTFPNNTGVPNLGQIGCLYSSPNPVWYFMQIADPGDMSIHISQTDNTGTGIDIDFALWGPFTSQAAGCVTLATSDLITYPTVDCSYSSAAQEDADIVGATTGQFYILLLTNYSQQPGTITFSQTTGSSSTDCSVMCNITGLTATPGACDSATVEYSVSGQITVTAPPTSGTLTITSSSGDSTTVPQVAGVWASPIAYTLNGLPANGAACTITATFSADPTCTFTVPYTAPPSCATCALTATNTGSTCPSGTFDLTSTDVVDVTGYSWSGPSAFTSNVQNPTGVVAPSTPGTYIYTVTATIPSGTCTATTTLTVDTNPTVTVPSNITICNGATVSATAFTSAPAGATYAWTNSNTAIGLGAGGNGDVPTFTATNTGSTSISATISVIATLNGCTGIASTYTITVDPTPTVTNSPLSQTICNDGNTSLVTLTSNVSGATFDWTASATAGITGFTASGTATIPVQTINNSGTTAGTVIYTITPTANGCIGTSSNYIITINPTPTVTVSNNSPICAGQTLNLNSSATNSTSYNWTGPNNFTSSAQNPSITTVTLGANGTYDVTITLANGCTGTGQTTVTINDNITVTVSSNSPVCVGQSLNLTSLPASAVSYNWTGPNNYTSNAQNPTIASVTTSATGNYSVLLTDINGCTGTASLSTIINPIPTSTFEFTQINCFGNNSTVTYTGDGISGATYTWDFGTATVVSGSGQGPYSINYTTAGTFPVSLQVTQYGCVSNTTSQNIINPTLLNLTLTKTDVTCYGSNNGSVTSTVSGGTLPYSYLWSSGSVFSAIPTALTGNYTLTVTDGNGCQINKTITVNEPPKVAIDVPSYMAICNGSSVTIVTSVTGGVFPYSVAWNTGSQSPNITVSPDTTTHYIVTATDANGCTSVSDILVYVYPPLTLSTSINTDSICLGEKVIIAATVTGGNNGPYSYFLNGQPGQPPYTLYPTSNLSYILVVKDGCNYSAQATIPVHVYPSPIISPSSDVINGCVPLAVQFNESSLDEGQTYLWNFSDNEAAFVKNPLHIFNEPGTYDVSLTVTNNYGCTLNHFYPDWITAYPLPEAQFVSNPSYASMIKPIISFVNYSSLTDSVMWYFGDGDSSSVLNPTHKFPSSPTGIYEITLIAFSSYGCSDTIKGKIEIKEEFTFYAPTAFSPDNDGINEVFIMSASGIKEETFHVAVYDRWGEIIYESTNISQGWDGRVKGGEKAPIGSYTWIATFRDFKKVLHERTGMVTVIR